jgi:hypothetical protein
VDDSASADSEATDDDADLTIVSRDTVIASFSASAKPPFQGIKARHEPLPLEAKFQGPVSLQGHHSKSFSSQTSSSIVEIDRSGLDLKTTTAQRDFTVANVLKASSSGSALPTVADPKIPVTTTVAATSLYAGSDTTTSQSPSTLSQESTPKPDPAPHNTSVARATQKKFLRAEGDSAKAALHSSDPKKESPGGSVSTKESNPGSDFPRPCDPSEALEASAANGTTFKAHSAPHTEDGLPKLGEAFLPLSDAATAAVPESPASPDQAPRLFPAQAPPHSHARPQIPEPLTANPSAPGPDQTHMSHPLRSGQETIPASDSAIPHPPSVGATLPTPTISPALSPRPRLESSETGPSKGTVSLQMGPNHSGSSPGRHSGGSSDWSPLSDPAAVQGAARVGSGPETEAGEPVVVLGTGEPPAPRLVRDLCDQPAGCTSMSEEILGVVERQGNAVQQTVCGTSESDEGCTSSRDPHRQEVHERMPNRTSGTKTPTDVQRGTGGGKSDSGPSVESVPREPISGGPGGLTGRADCAASSGIAKVGSTCAAGVQRPTLEDQRSSASGAQQGDPQGAGSAGPGASDWSLRREADSAISVMGTHLPNHPSHKPDTPRLGQ